MDFHDTSMGKKFFNVDVPLLIRQLKYIAAELKKYNDEQVYPDDLVDKPLGKFEEISEDEQLELNQKRDRFDEWFKVLLKAFELQDVDDFTIDDVKNLARHAWNATDK